MDDDCWIAISRAFLALTEGVSRGHWRSGNDQHTCGFTWTKQPAGEDTAHIIPESSSPEANTTRPGELQMEACYRHRNCDSDRSQCCRAARSLSD